MEVSAQIYSLKKQLNDMFNSQKMPRKTPNDFKIEFTTSSQSKKPPVKPLTLEEATRLSKAKWFAAVGIATPV